ncbi:MAG: hypothetical protein PHU88_04740 [candidate division Zixibacteria bacterium]|nr:hypothetical protein [candidate division Zixibacteria bacterium]MDD5426818.1 hypothetical protein [candidate division Zixibacteria bacterium]
MRKLVLLVGVAVWSVTLLWVPDIRAGEIIPTIQSSSGKFGFYPITNEISVYKNVDDAGEDRGQTVQIILINSVKLLTAFNIEFTADYNFDYTEGLDRDHYIELSLVKPVTKILSLNVQRVISTFEPESINQFGFRLSL